MAYERRAGPRRECGHIALGLGLVHLVVIEPVCGNKVFDVVRLDAIFANFIRDAGACVEPPGEDTPRR